MKPRYIRVIAPIVLLFISAWSKPAPPTPFQSYPYLAPYNITDNGRTLDVAKGNETDYHVDVSGLVVDLNCAEHATLSGIESIRVDLLKQGCARIVGTPIDAAEAEAQNYAKSNHLGVWALPPTPSASPSSSAQKHSSIPGSVWSWIKAHKLISYSSVGLLLSILASPWLVKFVWWIVSLLYRRRVNIIIAGAVAAGKTGLWTAWKEEYSTRQISNLSPTAGIHRESIEPVMLEKWTLQPTLIDAAGAEPWHILREMSHGRGKRILLYVVASSALEAANGTPYDMDYINRQEGYAHLPMAIINQPGNAKPDLVVMFVTKFDLFSDISPSDSDGKATAQVASLFKAHRRLVESACKRANIPFIYIIGSAKRGWGIGELRKSLARLIRLCEKPT